MPNEQLGLGINAEAFNRAVKQSENRVKSFSGALGDLVKVMVRQTNAGISLTKQFQDYAGVVRNLETMVSKSKTGVITTQTTITQAVENTNVAISKQIQLLNSLRRGLGQQNATSGPASSPNELTPEIARAKQLTSIVTQTRQDQLRSLREVIQARYADADAQEQVARRERRILAQRRREWEKFQRGPLEYVDNIRRRALSLFEVVSVFRVLDASVQGFTQGLQNAVDVSVRIGEIQTIDRAATSYNKLFDSVIKISSEFGETPQRVSEALYQTISNQIASGEAAIQFVRDATKFSLATVTSVEKAVNTLSSTLNSYNLGLSRTNEISANFFKTIELGRIRAEDFQSSIGDLSNLAQQVGVSYQELNAAIALTTIQGVKPAEAFTRIRNILIKLIKPTDDMKEALASFGYQSGDAALQALGFGGVLQKLEEYAQGNASRMAALYGNIRAITGAFIFAGEGLNRYNQILSESTTSTLQYDNAINIISQNSGRKIRIAFQTIANSFTVFGNQVIDVVARLQEHFVKFEDGVLAIAKGVAGLVVAGGFATLAAAAASAARALFLFRTAAVGAADGATVLRISMGGWVGLFAGAAVAIGEGIYLWTEYAESIKTAAREEASARSNRFLEDVTQRFAKASQETEFFVRTQARSVAQLIGLRQQQRNAVLSEAQAEFERQQYFNEASRDDFIETYRANKATVISAYRDMKNTAQSVIAEISRAQNEGIVNTLDSQLERVTNPRTKSALIQRAITDMRRKLLAAAGQANLPEFQRIVQDIESLLAKQKSIEVSVAGEYGLRRASLAAEQRSNNFLTEKLNLLQQIGVRSKQLADQQRQDAIKAAAESNRIQALSQTVFGFKPKDIGDLESVAEVATLNQDAQAAAAELRKVTTDQTQLAVLNKRAAEIALLAATKIAIINEEDRRNQLTGATTELGNRMTDVDAELQIRKQYRTQLEAAGRGQAEREFADRLDELNEKVRIASANMGVSIQERAARDAFKNQEATFAAEIVQNFTAAQDEQIKILDRTMQDVRERFRVQGIAFEQTNLPTALENLQKAASNLSYTFERMRVMIPVPIGASQGFASGGRTDVVPAMLTPGEFVMNRNASSKFYSQLSHMNSGTQARGYQTGGSIGDVTINVQSDRTPVQTARMIRRELQSMQRQNVR